MKEGRGEQREQNRRGNRREGRREETGDGWRITYEFLLSCPVVSLVRV